MNILLCCSAGMSTSLLARNMKRIALAAGEDHEIWTVPGESVKHHINKADVLLLGPQLRYLLPVLEKLGDERGIPVDVINMIDYGTCNGEKVLAFAKELVLSKNNTVE